MEEYIRISNINDFCYCPISLYLHSVFEEFDKEINTELPQVIGTFNHLRIDKAKYSTSSRYLTGIDVYSERLGVAGKIDIYDKEKEVLIERKTYIKTLHPGYEYQLFAQYFCMIEMGYKVKKLVLRSLNDNKSYIIQIPKDQKLQNFLRILEEMKKFDTEQLINHSCPHCRNHIYNSLNWR